ncbi:hypothetical protein HNY73_007360 [Argiope bruennichi]|uniref:Uncharacterized protein n=1 Tax=Argiope bruennichi TaxID=94029 RepID=A0A8T0FGB2_ARGBR|nr:hypothetical protein HNY73_007360 [Argiope bruennichi]
MNPESCLILKEKERIKYLRKKEKGQVKTVSEMTNRNLRIKRKQWKNNSRNYRLKKQAATESIENDANEPPSTENFQESQVKKRVLSEVRIQGKKLYNSKSTVSSVDDCNKGKNSEVLNIGDWVLVEYEKNLYPGELKAMCLKYVTVDVMVPARGGKYKWPFPKDIHNYPRTDIKRKISQPIPYDNRASQFYFPNL